MTVIGSPITSKSPSESINTELSSRRTGMSFQRTRLSAERTLMAIIRTSLALISFGFTIYQFFARLKDTNLLSSASPAPRNFGLSLVLLGAFMLMIGIWYHAQFMWGLRVERRRMIKDGIVHGESAYPVSLTLIVATVLFLISMLAIVSMVFRVGPFE